MSDGMNRFLCPGCGRRLKYGDEHAGKKAKCQSCGQSLQLPATTAPLASRRGQPEDLMGDERPKHRTDIGEKMKCPKCGSDHVRAMSSFEMEDYLGWNRFVLSVPRKCKACGHGYKAIRSKAENAVLCFAALVTLGLVLGGALLSDEPGHALFSIACIFGCLVVLLLLVNLISAVDFKCPRLAWVLGTVGAIISAVGAICRLFGK